MKFFKTLCMVLFLIVMSVNILAAGANKTTITFWNGFTGPDGEILREIVTRFNKENDKGINIKMDIMPWDVFFQKLPPAIATDTAPSFVLLDPVNIPQYASNDALQILDDFWSVTGLKESDYLENVLNMMKHNGHYYELPMQTNLFYLYWNKDLFREAGLDPERPPQTMEELADFAVKLTNPQKNQFGFGMPISGVYAVGFLWNNGGEIYDLKVRKSLLDSPQNIKTLEWMQNLAVNKKVTPRGATGPELDNLLMSGQLAMYINGPWLINGLRKNGINFGITAPPKGSVRQQVPAGGVGFAVPSGTSAEEKKAVYEFIKYWMSPQILKEWSMRNGFPVWSHAVMNDPEIKADPIQRAISPLGSLGRFHGHGFQHAAALDNDILWPMLESILAGVEKPAGAVRKASQKIDALLQK